MKLKNTLVALFALSLATACVPEPPDGGNNDDNNNNGTEECTSDAQCSGATPVCSAGTCIAEDNPPECTSNAQCSGDTPICEAEKCVADDTLPECSSDAECSGDTPVCQAEKCVAPPEPCTVNTDFSGQIGGEGDFGGGVLTNDPSESAYEADSGLKGVYDFIVTKIEDGTIVEDDESTADVEEDRLDLEAGSELQISGAVVTAVTFNTGNGTFVQDDQIGLAIYAGEFPETDVDGNPFSLKIGQKLDFKVTAVSAFGAQNPQISGVSDVKVVGADVSVYVEDRTGQDITAADWGKTIRVGGSVASYAFGKTSRDDAGCGGSSICYNFTHGDEGSEKTTLLRSGANYVDVGKCATYVGPVNLFPGPLADDPDIQLNTGTFDWLFVPFD